MYAHNKGNLCARCYITFLVSKNAERKEGRKEGHNMLDQYLYFSFSVLLFKLTKILPITFLVSFDNHIDTILKIDNA